MVTHRQINKHVLRGVQEIYWRRMITNLCPVQKLWNVVAYQETAPQNLGTEMNHITDMFSQVSGRFSGLEDYEFVSNPEIMVMCVDNMRLLSKIFEERWIIKFYHRHVLSSTQKIGLARLLICVKSRNCGTWLGIKRWLSKIFEERWF